MSITESSANTLVRFTGLGIVCFNEEKRRGEIAVIRDGRHTLSVKIQQPRYLDGRETDVIVYENLAVYQDLPKTSVEIEIKAESNPSVRGFEIYQAEDENFSRLDGEDVNDFRWIVDLNDLHEENLVESDDENKYPVTKLFIADGLFYTHKLDTELYFEKIEKDANGIEKNRADFGNVAETIGVKIEADEVLFKIKTGGTEDTQTLEKINGLPYRIVIANMDYNEDASYSDMPDYYKYLASANGEKFDLEPVTDEENGDGLSGGGVTGKQFCHPIRARIGSIDELL
jgi:hypothetical protein